MYINDISVDAERKSRESDKLYDESQAFLIIDDILDRKTILGDIPELIEG